MTMASLSYKSRFVSCEFDLDAPGKRFGAAQLLFSDNENAGRIHLVPIVVIANGDGPTVLLCAGTHGNEDQGQMVLRRMVHELEPSEVTGRVVILPALNYPAVRAWSRTSPLDNGNLNRSFPGDEASGPTSALARFVVDALLPRCDAGMDLHSGGPSSEWACSAFLCTCADPEVYRRSVAMAEAFHAPYLFVVDGRGSPTGFDPVAHACGVPFVSTELGGGGISRETLDIGYRGVRAVLAHLGVLEVPTGPLPEYETVCLSGFRGAARVLAPFEGLVQTMRNPGDRVEAGEVAAVLHSLDEVARPPAELVFPASGVVYARHSTGRVVHGTVVCQTAPETTLDEVRALANG
jgi:predicted deacylase